ncbi:MAG: alkaline phosphatase family protein [Parvularculaceae bacterium]
MLFSRMMPAVVLAMAFAGCTAKHEISESNTAAKREPKVVLVTFDGVRWEDVFHGADPALIDGYVDPDMKEDVAKAYGEAAGGGAAVMPFLHGVIGKDGVLIGDRDAGQCAKVENDMWFSYPGYSELLAGKPNPDILENDPIPNKDVTVLEWANKDADFAGKVEMIGTWTLFPYIVNAERSGVAVNAAFGDNFPTDIRTGAAGYDLLKKKPRLLYIAFGDTDEFAHLGDYWSYLEGLERGDDYLRRLWERLQADPFYRDQTTLIVTTDHGRGHAPDDGWKDHSSPRYHGLYPDYQPQFNGKGVIGSDAIWVAAMGPAVNRNEAARYDADNCALQAQVAKSVVVALGRDADEFEDDAAPPFDFIRKPAP